VSIKLWPRDYKYWPHVVTPSQRAIAGTTGQRRLDWTIGTQPARPTLDRSRPENVGSFHRHYDLIVSGALRVADGQRTLMSSIASTSSQED
jgi:hypothetical protein